MSDPTPNAADPTPAADPAVVVDPAAVTDPTPSDPPADPNASDPTADPPADPADPNAADPNAADPNKPAEGAPEAYADFTVPDGIQLDPEATDELKTVAKELNLPQEKAQQFVDLAVKLQQKNHEAGEKLFEDRGGVVVHPAYAEKWIAEAKTQFSEADIATAKRAVDVYGGEQFKQFLDQSGMGNNPHWIGFALKAGKAVSEDNKVISGGKVSTPQRDIAAKLFPNANKE